MSNYEYVLGTSALASPNQETTKKMGFIHAEDQNWADDIDDRDSSEDNCIKIRDDTHLDKEQSG